LITAGANTSASANPIVLHAVAQQPGTSPPDEALTVQTKGPEHAGAVHVWAPAVDAPTRDRMTHTARAPEPNRLGGILSSSPPLSASCCKRHPGFRVLAPCYNITTTGRLGS